MMATSEQKNRQAAPSTRQRAVEAYDDARVRARDEIESSPLLALGGGLALGAFVAAILPRTRTEQRLLGDVGGRITGTARNAYEAATEAGREKLAELNVAEHGKGAVQSLVDGLTEAARTSGKAALDSARSKG